MLRYITASFLVTTTVLAAACGVDERSREVEETTVAREAPTPGARCGGLVRTVKGHGRRRGAVCEISIPRADLSVELGGAALPPGMGLTAWTALAPAGDSVAFMAGELPATGDELHGLLSALRDGGFRVTAVHRHMRGESPAVSFVHFVRRGEAMSMARAFSSVLGGLVSARGRRRVAPARGPGQVAGASCVPVLDTLGVRPGPAVARPGYCQVSRVRRDLSPAVEGTELPMSLWTRNRISFRETKAGDTAVLTGEFVLTEEEVAPAVQALREEAVDVAALHAPLHGTRPRLFHLHFQGRGRPMSLAVAARRTLAAVASPGPSTGSDAGEGGER